MSLKGIPLVGYTNEPIGSLFVHAATPGLAFKSGNSQSYLLAGTPIGPTGEPNGSLWVSSSTSELCFAYGGQAYQVNRHRVRNNITDNSVNYQVRLQAFYTGTQQWSFTDVTPGQTSSERIGTINGLVGATITGIQVDNKYFSVPNFVPPYNGGVIVVSGTAYENDYTGVLGIANLSLSWSPT